MKSLTKLLVTVILMAVILSPSAASLVEAQTVDSARASVHDAYTAVLEASEAGGDVTELIAQLNDALDLVAQAENLSISNPVESQHLATQAQSLASMVLEQAPLVKDAGLAQGQTSALLLVGLVVVLVVAGVLVYVFGQKFMWKIWLKLRGNYRIATKPSSSSTSAAPQKSEPILTIKTVSAVILVAVLIIAFFAVALVYLQPQNSEAFSELGILGPNMNLGDYPSVIVAGETVHLYGYVGNHMGRPMDYVLMIKLGNNETVVNPASLDAIAQYEQIISHNGTWVFPINLTLTQAGTNQRLIFELWTYNETLNQNVYHERWGQLWLNVTAPAT